MTRAKREKLAEDCIEAVGKEEILELLNLVHDSAVRDCANVASSWNGLPAYQSNVARVILAEGKK